MSAAILPFARPQALAVAEPLGQLPEFAVAEAERCLAIIRPALVRVQQSVSVRAAAAWLAVQGQDMPSAPTLERWIHQYLREGIAGLAPKYKGRQRADYGWEAEAQKLYAKPTKPAYSTVALWLRQRGHDSAKDHLVRRYLKSLPSNLAETSPARLGAHYYGQNIRPYVIRDLSALPVGMVYEGDGHCCDVYVAEPSTGNPYRPELTVWLDVRSHYVVGWWLSDRESANTTLFSLSCALLKHDHTPGFVHADPGPGFVAKTIIDEQSGFLARFSIKPITALPGNAKGKGLVEGFFRWFEERCGKQFATFCQGRSDDALSRLRQRIAKGEIELPTLQQYADAVRDYFDFYNRNPQAGLGKQSPAQLWATLVKVPLETAAAAIIRPREPRTVRRWGVALHGRIYRAGDLARYEGRKVLVEYDLHNDMRVWIKDEKGRFVAEAALVEKRAWLSDSRIEDQEQKRLEGQRQRKLNDIAEMEARARRPISAVSALQALEMEAPTLLTADSAATEMLGQGHDYKARKAVTASAPRPFDPVELDAIRAALNEAAEPEQETPEQRFGRAMAMRERLSLGEVLSATEQRWFTTYTQSSECQGLADVYESFGYVPGLELPQKSQGRDTVPERSEVGAGAALGGGLRADGFNDPQKSPAATGPSMQQHHQEI